MTKDISIADMTREQEDALSAKYKQEILAAVNKIDPNFADTIDKNMQKIIDDDDISEEDTLKQMHDMYQKVADDYAGLQQVNAIAAADSKKQKESEAKKIVADSLRNNPSFFDGAVSFVGLGLQFSGAADTLSSFGLPLNKKLYGDTWQTNVEKYVPSPIALLTDKVCQNRQLLKREPSVIATTASGQVGLTLLAQRIPSLEKQTSDILDKLRATDAQNLGIDVPTITTTQPAYQYAVKGRLLVQNTLDENGNEVNPVTSYTVTLDGPSGRSAPLVQDTFSTGEPVVWTDSNTLKLSTDVLYTQVCITFERDLSDLFSKTTMSGNEACLPIGSSS
jgi:hypothetical protein